MNQDILLKKLEVQEIASKNFGFYWQDLEQLIAQIKSECDEVTLAHKSVDQRHLQEEIGDLMHAAASLAVFCGFDPVETIEKSIEKFQKRFDTLVSISSKAGLPHLQGQPMEVLTDYWEKAKKLTS